MRAATRLSLPRRGRVAAEGGRVGRNFVQGVVYQLKHTGQIFIDIAVPESQTAKAVLCKLSIASHIARTMCVQIVLTTIDFDHKAMFHTNKINDIASPR